jgi:carboxyl-terminal processing protease
MRKKSSKAEFLALFTFLAGAVLVLTNGFSAHIFAQDEERAVYEQIEPIGEVLAEILQNYVYEPDLDKAVEGALMGIMSSLDRNSSYIPAEMFTQMREDTEGEFEGIGVQIKIDEENRVFVFQPFPDAPAAKAGMKSGDIIVGVDGVEVEDFTSEATNVGEKLSMVSDRIKGPKGTSVDVTVERLGTDGVSASNIEINVKRGKIPVTSIKEARMIQGGIGYLRIGDFRKKTAEDIRDQIKDFEQDGMRALVLDLRWNPGGLLNASRDVCELFLPKGSLVTSTRGRANSTGRYLDDMALRTEKKPIIPETMPLVVLVSGGSASSSEIVTGALQFHKRALIIGEQTFGKGSVQTIIPLSQPVGAALRLTTALYYTPGDVTIDLVGISPDIGVEMDGDAQYNLRVQMIKSIDAGPEFINRQNHGRVTGNLEGEKTDELIHDVVLERALGVINEDSRFENLLEKYHRDIRDTQKMASDEAIKNKVH